MGYVSFREGRGQIPTDRGLQLVLGPFFSTNENVLPPWHRADDSSMAQREAMLAAVRAQGAQLMSLQKVPCIRVD